MKAEIIHSYASLTWESGLLGNVQREIDPDFIGNIKWDASPV